jgi:FAD/FMN-containing dehydrogenase
MSGTYENWGRTGKARRAALAANDLPDRLTLPDGWLPYGNGRSYGDTCHNDAGTLIDSRARDAVLAFDTLTGTITCEAGATLAAIFERVVPEGYFLPVTPGTAQVTVGGAIANDVHGKNHHVRGTFGAHVEALTLRSGDGAIRHCSPKDNAELFAATIGGMGLTGLILDARIRLMRVTSPDIRQRTIRFDHIDRYFEQIDAIDAKHEYSVAWIDQLATGRNLGRGVLMAGDHAHERAGGGKGGGRRLAIPFAPPFNMLNRVTLKAFNELYFRKEKPGETLRTIGWRAFLHPLDAIGGWNRLYGPRGLFQHQSVYPEAQAPETTVRLMECARRHGHASFLTVLKRFGAARSPGLFSFPRPGFTLTLDFADQGAATRAMLDRLDEIVVAAGGAVNPYKDARMSPSTFEASFAQWRLLEARRDPTMMSDFWRRTAMRLDPETGQAANALKSAENSEIARI